MRRDLRVVLDVPRYLIESGRVALHLNAKNVLHDLFGANVEVVPETEAVGNTVESFRLVRTIEHEKEKE